MSITCMTCGAKLKAQVAGLSGVFPCPKCSSMVLVTGDAKPLESYSALSEKKNAPDKDKRSEEEHCERGMAAVEAIKEAEINKPFVVKFFDEINPVALVVSYGLVSGIVFMPVWVVLFQIVKLIDPALEADVGAIWFMVSQVITIAIFVAYIWEVLYPSE